MKLVPLGEKVIVKRIQSEPATPGGIVLPEASRPKPQQGRVLSVGDGRLLADGSRAAMQIVEGDRVLFNGGGSEVVVNGDRLVILPEDEVLAIVP